MPRTGTGHGGKRQGKPGVSHPNRTDLNVDRAPAGEYKGQTYGTAVAQQDAQQAVPVQAPQGPPPVPMMPEGAPKAGSMGDLFGPTEHPDEPVTAGATEGAGPGPEALGIRTMRDQDLENLAARNLYPLLAWASSRRGGPSTVAFVRNIRSGMT